jgi:hypothetical protein
MFKKALGVMACALAMLGSSGLASAQTTSLESVPLWRIQVEVHVCDKSDAGTDDGVGIILNDTTGFRFDTGTDDFERNRTYTYDVVTPSVSRVSDIDQLTFYLTGNDAVCIDNVKLRFNEAGPFFERAISGGRWLDGNSSTTTPVYTITSQALRASSTWNLAGARASAAVRPSVIRQAALVSMIEASVGHDIHGTSFQWGHIYNGSAVEFVARNTGDDTASHRVDLDLEYDVPAYFNPEIDVDYLSTYTCNTSNNQISATASQIKTKIHGTGPDWIFAAINWVANFGIGFLEDRINNLGEPGFTGYVAGCPTMVTQANNDLAFTYPSIRPAPPLVFEAVMR